MPRTTRSQSKKASSGPNSSSQTQPESATTDTTSGADPESSSLPLPPPTTARNLRPRALRRITTRPSSVVSSASSSSSSTNFSLTKRRNRARGGSRPAGGRSRASSTLSSEIVGNSDARGTTGIVEGSTTTTARGHSKLHQEDISQAKPESEPAGSSGQPTERQHQPDHGPPRPDWRNWEESDNEEGLDQLREDEDNEDEEESQVARHLEPTTSSSSQVGTPRQHHSMISSSSPTMAVAVTNPCSIIVTTTSPAAAAAGPASQQTTTTTSTSTTVTPSMNHPSAPGPASLNNLITSPPASSPPSSWRATQTPASPVTSASLQKIINDVNVEPNVSGRRSAAPTATAMASPPATGTTNGPKRKREGSPDVEIIEISSLPPPTKKRDKGKGKARAFSLSPSPPPKPPTQSPPNTTKTQPQNAEEPLSEYTCPICFFPPSNATLTPCGHVCCGSCLFTAVKTTLQRGVSMGMMIGVGENVARCPVCRAAIPGWDGRGGGVVGIQVRQIITL